jgi:hypothetical protein
MWTVGISVGFGFGNVGLGPNVSCSGSLADGLRLLRAALSRPPRTDGMTGLRMNSWLLRTVPSKNAARPAIVRNHLRGS